MFTSNVFKIQYIKAMGNLLYVIAVILVISWLVGFFAYGASGLIHALLVLAVISVLVSVIRGSNRV